MTTENAVGLSLREAALEAEAELGLTEPSGDEPVSSPTPLVDALEQEQPAVEQDTSEGLFDELVEEDEQPVDQDSITLEVGGEVRTYTRDQLRDGIMMQADYTRKTQEIAERERAAEKAITLLQLLETRPVETISRLSRQVNSGTPFSFENQQVPATEQPEVPTDIEELISSRVAEALENDPRIRAVQTDAAVTQVNKAFTEIEKMYDVSLTDSDKQVVLEHAQKMDTVDLGFVFGGLYAQTQRAEIAKANAKASATVRPQSTSDGFDLTPVAPERYDTFRSALEASLAEDQGLETVSNL